MSLAFILYAVEAAVLLGIAAVLAEQAARRQHWPTRGIWAAALMGSILLPLLAVLLPSASPALAPIMRYAVGAIPSALPGGRGEPWIRAVWIMLSLLLALWLCVGTWRVSVQSRTWRRTAIEGVMVYVAARIGPAVFGFLRPRIVVPEWFARLPQRQRELAIAHERAHLEAHDPLLLAAAFALVTLMPWNPSMWWLLKRLRQAIEIDCDARVLHGGCGYAEYGEALILVAEHRSGRSWAMAAMVPSQSLLERRIQIMSLPSSRRGRSAAFALAALSVAMVGFAAELSPPASVAPPAGLVWMRDDALNGEAVQLRERAAKIEAEAKALGERAAKQAAEMTALDADALKHAAQMRGLEERARKLAAEALEIGAMQARRAAEELESRAKEQRERAAEAAQMPRARPPL